MGAKRIGGKVSVWGRVVQLGLLNMFWANTQNVNV